MFPLLAALATSAHAAETTATVVDRDGNEIGTVNVTDTPSGVVLLELMLSNLPRGIHAVHLHEVGDCSASDFTSAGGHIADGRSHGILSENGPHPGDLPNLFVGRRGRVHLELFVPDVDVQRDLLSGDGAAFVVHAGRDDYQTDPAGDAGDRIACGVFE